MLDFGTMIGEVNPCIDPECGYVDVRNVRPALAIPRYDVRIEDSPFNKEE